MTITGTLFVAMQTSSSSPKLGCHCSQDCMCSAVTLRGSALSAAAVPKKRPAGLQRCTSQAQPAQRPWSISNRHGFDVLPRPVAKRKLEITALAHPVDLENAPARHDRQRFVFPCKLAKLFPHAAKTTIANRSLQCSTYKLNSCMANKVETSNRHNACDALLDELDQLHNEQGQNQQLLLY